MPNRGSIQLLPQTAWQRLKEFCAVSGDSTYLWPRWIILRAVGLVYVIIFCGIIDESSALIGPNGLQPVQDVFGTLAKQYPNPFEAVLRVPSLFWISTSPAMISGLQWLGLAASVAVVLNLWPRLALAVSWVVFLSIAHSGVFFLASAPDPLMLEVALLCIPFAPPGLLPGLGAKAAPRPIAVFALRWLLLRLMLEAGLAKFVYGNDLWRNLTAMDYMYQSAPSPTIMGYWDFQMPHLYHVAEIGLTFVAEMVAPFFAIFGNRRWRWLVFWVWAVFQLGIEVTNNFAWLQVASIAMGVLLLDDTMLAGAANRFRLPRLGAFIMARTAGVTLRATGPWARWGLRAALGLQIALTLFFYVLSPARIPLDALPAAITRPVVLLFGGLYSANPYPLFGSLLTTRYEVEFIGSNDGGETWRSYDSRYQAQRVDRVCPFIAPRFPRLEAAMQITMLNSTDQTFYQAVAAHLLAHEPAVIRLFRYDPFPDRPATMVRLPTYQLAFTDAATLRKTGRYWTKEYVGEYAPMLYINERGEVVSQD